MIFSVDWEAWFCLYNYSNTWNDISLQIEEPTLYLLDILKRHNVKAIFYILGYLADKRPDLLELIKKDGHLIGDHTYYHTYEDYPDEKLKDPLFRAPRFHKQKRLYSGGFWFRLLPYWLSKIIILKTGIFYIHPHDVMEKSPINNFKRTVGLKTVRDKLERLMREVEFKDAHSIL